MNMIGICAVSSICALLLIASQHRIPLPDSAGYSTQVVNETATIGDILTLQRARIAREMENFDYPCGRFGVDAEKLSDMTPETGGKPVRSVIITTWRSGSTFLGDILNAMPGNYYHYEPLLNFDIVQIRGPPMQDVAVLNLKNLLNCNYTDMHDYLAYGKDHPYLFQHNVRLWNQCSSYPQYCWQPRFLEPFCRLFPLQSMKVVRIRLALTESLLKDESLNVRIILLIRDPRGTMQSRKHRLWCPGNPDCDEESRLCADLEADYKAAQQFTKKYASRFKVVRYEDLSLSPYDLTQEILQFLGLPFDSMVEEFLDTHTKIDIGGVSSTFRDSKATPFHWKRDLSWDEIESIQGVCTKAMEAWGYKKFNFSSDLLNFEPLLAAPFT